MRANSPFLLAKCAHELSRIVAAEGDKLDRRSRVHLTRMTRMLLRAAGEGEAAATVDGRTGIEIAELLREGGVGVAEVPAMNGVDDTGCGVCRQLDEAWDVLGDLIATRGLEAGPGRDPLAMRAVAVALEHRDRVDAVLAGVEAGEGQRERTADEQRRPIEVDRLNRYLAERGLAGRITSLQPLWTESSKEISLIETDAGGGWPRRGVLRRERPYAIVANSVADEYDVLAATHAAGLPVPRPLFAEHDAALLDGRVIATSFASGAIGTIDQHGAVAVPVVAAAAAFLAGLHRVSWERIAKVRAEAETSPRDHLRRRIAECARTWRAARLEPEPAMEAALAWLTANVERLDDDAVIVHGDFDLRNMLVDNGRLTTVLDWEFVKFGHRAEDLGYFYDRVTEVMSWPAFIGHYHAAGGAPIDDFSVQYHRVLAWTLRATIVVTAYSGYWRGAHDDFRLGGCAFYEYPDHVRRLSRALLELG